MRRDGFTLIELLVVVAIVGLLVAILLPSLARSRDVARGMACQSNLKQVAIGSLSYAAQHQGYLPNYYEYDSLATQFDQSGYGASWAWRLDHFLEGNGRQMYRCPSFAPYPGKVPIAIAGFDTTTQGWAYGSSSSYINPAPDKRLFRTDYGTFYLGFSEVRKLPRQGYPNINKLEKKAYYNGRADLQPLVAEARHLYQYTVVSSLQYWQYSASDYNKLLNATLNPEVSPTTASDAFAFSTLHNGGSNLPFADGHVKLWSRADLFAQKPF